MYWSTRNNNCSLIFSSSSKIKKINSLNNSQKKKNGMSFDLKTMKVDGRNNLLVDDMFLLDRARQQRDRSNSNIKNSPTRTVSMSSDFLSPTKFKQNAKDKYNINLKKIDFENSESTDIRRLTTQINCNSKIVKRSIDNLNLDPTKVSIIDINFKISPLTTKFY